MVRITDIPAADLEQSLLLRAQAVLYEMSKRTSAEFLQPGSLSFLPVTELQSVQL